MLWLIPSGLKSSKMDVAKNIENIGQLMTPRTWHMNQLDEYPFKWAGDNDCFTGNFQRDKFIKWLDNARRYQDRCLFIACPDVVSDFPMTLKQFESWETVVRDMGYPVALVLQDKIQSTNIPWNKIDAVFVGGSTEWKLSQNVIELLVEAGERGKWRHIGRINSLRRMKHFWNYADSFDGTDYVFHPEGAVKMYLPQIEQRKLQLELLNSKRS